MAADSCSIFGFRVLKFIISVFVLACPTPKALSFLLGISPFVTADAFLRPNLLTQLGEVLMKTAPMQYSFFTPYPEPIMSVAVIPKHQKAVTFGQRNYTMVGGIKWSAQVKQLIQTISS